LFKSKDLSLELNATIDCGDDPQESGPEIAYKKVSGENHLGEGITASFNLKEGQGVSFILRDLLSEDVKNIAITPEVVDRLQTETESFWFNWISKSLYKGRWREVVSRSLLILKLLTYEATGAIVAAPTFSIPEDFGGVRNWDYRFSWIRDSSFTIYILLRMGFTEEAKAYMSFISDRFTHSRSPEGALPIMFSKCGVCCFHGVMLSPNRHSRLHGSSGD
jgi:GH15 family glucan-1,4-alpha-glucosidase